MADPNIYGIQDISTFGDPFKTYANAVYPRNVREMLLWADWLWQRHGVYSMAIQRSIRYFLNEVEVFGDSLAIATKRQYHERLMDDFNVLDHLALVGDDRIGYGNSFTSVYKPIERQLICPKCGTLRVLRDLKPQREYSFITTPTGGEFRTCCPSCSYEGIHTRHDTVDMSFKRGLKVIRWSPYDLEIDHCAWSDEAEYYFTPKGDVAGKVKAADHLTLATIPWEFAEATLAGKILKFDRNTFLHLRNRSSATLVNYAGGWGLPTFMSNFSKVVMLQILDKYNEAIASDYITPIRLLTAQTASGGLDPMKLMDSSVFMNMVTNIITNKRRDPTSWHFLPAPIDYHVIGGEAKNLVPVELIDRELDSLLTSMGIATEMYRGSVTVSGPPTGLRLFEKTWLHHVNDLNYWLSWYMDNCRDLLMWEDSRAKLVITSVVEDEMTKNTKLNLASSKVISRTTALRPLGLDVSYERKLMQDEALEDAEYARELQSRVSKDDGLSMFMQQAAPGEIPPNASKANNGLPPEQQGAGGAPAGAPAPAQGGAPGPSGAQAAGANPTLDQIVAQAQQVAQDLFSAPDRPQQLATLKKQNPALHAMVMQEIKNQEQSIKSDAVAQAKQPQQGAPM